MINHFRQLRHILKKPLSLAQKENMLTLEDIIPVEEPTITEPEGEITVSFLDMMSLEDSVRRDTDFFILERLKLIGMKAKWDINEATLAIQEACTKEWYRRYGEGATIPDVDLSEEALAQLDAEKEIWFD